ncbi:Hypp696 [Branchiostoma lanceolatum]|nr:Hypp696 [Branchiostoma lanceolatum]
MEILEEEGKWNDYDRFYRKACSHFAGNPDTLIRIVLENIVAAYYRNDMKDGQQSILRVQELVFQTQDPLHHQAHMLYLKSALFRKEKKYKEAENAIVLARQGLEQMQVGRDTGEIWYNVAALFAQALNDECTEISTSDVKAKATEAFQCAIEHYRQGGEEDGSCRNKLRRAHIRHAMSLLGCWSEVRPSNSTDDVTEDDLRQAGDSLDEVERNLWDGIPNRMRYYWHLARSDLFRYKNRMQRALEMAEEALKIAKASKFPSEVHFAEGRVKLLSKLVSDKRPLKNEESKSDLILEKMFRDENTITTFINNRKGLLILSVATVFIAVCIQYLLYHQ